MNTIQDELKRILETPTTLGVSTKNMLVAAVNAWRVNGVRTPQSEQTADQLWNAVVNIGNLANTPAPPQDVNAETDYELLRDAIIKHLNPDDDDIAETAIMTQAIEDAAEEIADLKAKLEAFHTADLQREFANAGQVQDVNAELLAASENFLKSALPIGHCDSRNWGNYRAFTLDSIQAFVNFLAAEASQQLAETPTPRTFDPVTVIDELRLIPEFNAFWTTLSEGTQEEICEAIEDEFEIAVMPPKSIEEMNQELSDMLADVKQMHEGHKGSKA